MGVRCVEILPGGSESVEVGGVVCEARLPPIATATCLPVEEEDDTNVVVCENIMLPAGGLVELQYALSVDMQVLDGPASPNGLTMGSTYTPRLLRGPDGKWVRENPPLREGENFTVQALPLDDPMAE